MKINLLSVDWDYFIKVRPEWCGSYIENNRCIINTWYKRYIEENIRGVDLEKEIKVNDFAFNFWDFIRSKYDFDNNLKIFVSDSHKFSYNIAEKYECNQVFLFDAHSDLGYGGLSSLEFELNCANWLGKLFKNKIIDKANIIYSPYTLEEQKDFEELNKIYNIKYLKLNQIEKEKISVIHICRSGAWSPPWLDKDFYNFLKQLKMPYKKLENIIRNWDPKGLTFSEEINYLIS